MRACQRARVVRVVYRRDAEQVERLRQTRRAGLAQAESEDFLFCTQTAQRTLPPFKRKSRRRAPPRFEQHVETLAAKVYTAVPCDDARRDAEEHRAHPGQAQRLDVAEHPTAAHLVTKRLERETDVVEIVFEKLTPIDERDGQSRRRARDRDGRGSRSER